MASSVRACTRLSCAEARVPQSQGPWRRCRGSRCGEPLRRRRAAVAADAQPRRCDAVRLAPESGLLPHMNRRQLLSDVLLLGTGCLALDEPAEAAYVDEERATRVFGDAQAGVVSLADYVVSGGEETVEGVGSGIVWDKLGHVVTNYHCIAKLANDRTGSQVAKVELSLPGGRSVAYRATLVGYEIGQDLAVLRVDAPPEELTPLRFGTSKDLRIGQSVYAIGNPFGLQHTLTVGCVSGLNRTIPSIAGDRIFGVIQTDAAISSGNSGGALLDSSGRLVGINTATFTKRGTGRSSGVNFAVPVDTVMSTVPRLIVKNSRMG